MRKIFNIKPKPYKKSYSQLGEDLVLDYLFNQINIDRPYYVGIGSNHPIKLSNTYFFYLKGSSGVFVDPNPIFKNFKLLLNKQVKIKKLKLRNIL